MWGRRGVCGDGDASFLVGWIWLRRSAVAQLIGTAPGWHPITYCPTTSYERSRRFGILSLSCRGSLPCQSRSCILSPAPGWGGDYSSAHHRPNVCCWCACGCCSGSGVRLAHCNPLASTLFSTTICFHFILLRLRSRPPRLPFALARTILAFLSASLALTLFLFIKWIIIGITFLILTLLTLLALLLTCG
eukprot:scaffold17153_cov107-Isochrysis_galbana.AAC.4